MAARLLLPLCLVEQEVETSPRRSRQCRPYRSAEQKRSHQISQILSGTITPASLDRDDTVNLMACLRRRLANHDEPAKITDAQNRIIMQRLAEAGTWARPRSPVGEQLAEIAGQVSALTWTAEARIRALLGNATRRFAARRPDRRTAAEPG
jgi:hypothetical protein